MSRGSPEHTQARRDEIIGACVRLYETMGFRDITIKEIADCTSFTRTSIYNYFQTKEEIFLAILQIEYDTWAAELDALPLSGRGDARLEFAESLAHTMEHRGRLLKLLSTNMNDMEINSRPENLVEFKRAYGASIQALRRCLERFCPSMKPEQVDSFLFSFLPLVYGIYPYAVVTDKQKAAMVEAKVPYRYHSIYELSCLGIKQLLGVQV